MEIVVLSCLLLYVNCILWYAHHILAAAVTYKVVNDHTVAP